MTNVVLIFPSRPQQVRGNKHSLIIRNVTYLDLGNYTCQASNSLGKDRGSLSLSGLPTICYFDSVRINLAVVPEATRF